MTRASLIAGIALAGACLAFSGMDRASASSRQERDLAEIEQQYVFRSELALTRLRVAVLDRDGAPVPGLEAGDFRVFEEGEERPVQVVLSPERNPLDVAVALDFSISVADRWPEARAAAHEFLDALEAEDCVYLVPFSVAVGPGVWGRPDDPELRRRIERTPFGDGTRLYDAIVDAQEALAGLLPADAMPLEAGNRAACTGEPRTTAGERRRALVVLTDGDDTGSQASYAGALLRSWRAEIPVFPVAVGYAARPGSRIRLQASRRNNWGSGVGTRAFADAVDRMRAQLTEIARVTGGQMLSQQEVRDGYGKVLSLLRGYYVVGYRSSSEAEQGWRDVEVSLPGRDLDVITQGGVLEADRDLDPAMEMLQQGQLAHRAGDLELALARFDRAATLDPELGSPHLARGLVLEGLQRWREALESYRRALELGPRLTRVFDRLAVVSLRLGDVDAAWRHAVRAHLAGNDVDGVLRVLSGRSEPPFDLEERLASTVVCVLDPEFIELQALLATQPVVDRIVTSLHESEERAYGCAAGWADLWIGIRVQEYERGAEGSERIELRISAHDARGESFEDREVELEGPFDEALLRQDLDPEIESLLEEVDPR